MTRVAEVCSKPLTAQISVEGDKIEYPEKLAIHKLFEDQVAKRPGELAAVFGEQSISYAALNSRANSLANYLLSNGLKATTGIAIYMDRSIDCLVSILAILKAGAYYVPLDTHFPYNRINYILNDSDIKTILVDSKSSEQKLKKTRSRLVNVSDPAIDSENDKNINHIVDSQSIAYCIYTSGSTGVPKGVAIHHQALVNYICWAIKQYVTDDARDFAFYSPLSFDLTVTSIFVPLVAGSTIHVYPDMNDNVSVLRSVLKDNKIDILKLTPAHLAYFDDLELAESRLKTLILGGEDLNADTAFEIHKKLNKSVDIYNEYGPTETTVGCIAYRYNPNKDIHGSVPIGKPIDNVKIQILNEKMNPVEPGEIGEIWISGDSVGKGYINNEKLNLERFVPTVSQPGGKLYRSGDLGLIRSDGEIVYLGRKDLQVKVRGYRVELGEVENTLLAYPGVKECVATVLGSTNERNINKVNLTYCTKCGVSSSFPNTVFTANNVCNHCQTFDKYRAAIDSFFRSMDDLRRILEKIKAQENKKYDCIIALSGGKDSTYALCKMVDLGARVFAFTLDNGYISVKAKDNIDRAVKHLEIDHRYITTKHMNKILTDSFERYSDACNGCFKTIYTFSINLAKELGVNCIVTGLSKGQLFETRLSALLRETTFNEVVFEKEMVEVRKLYHRVDDAVKRLLYNDWIDDEDTFEKVSFIDFYRYCDVSRDEIYSYIEDKVSWVRPSDTGRSTNCLLNDVAIYVHGKERKYHKYSLAYSWDVRMGHIKRKDAIRELDDEKDIDANEVYRILGEIGYKIRPEDEKQENAVLIAYYTATKEIASSDLDDSLKESLPEYMIPMHYVYMDKMPITPNGKVNKQALPRPTNFRINKTSSFESPRNTKEKQLADIWKELLVLDKVGINDNFFELGGYSFSALQLLLRIDAQFDKTITIEDFSERPTIRGLAELV